MTAVISIAALSFLPVRLHFAFGAPSEFQFGLLGDRTGEAAIGVYPAVWRETASEHPSFVLTVGDTIQGSDDHTVDAEWKQIMRDLTPYRKLPVFFAPGNHDVWSAASAQAFERYTKHPLHYSFNYQNAHFTILDNSRSEGVAAGEMAYLEKDLLANRHQPVKFIISHRPSWIVPVMLANPNFALHRLAKRYGVRYVIAGHVHQMLHFELEGVMYLSMASAGGHLRDTKTYEKGWFFGHTLVTVHETTAEFAIEELKGPFGRSRVSRPADWGAAGLVSGPVH